MSTDTVRTFESALDGKADDIVRTSPDTFSTDLAALLEPPTVGTALRGSLSYDDASVTVDPTPQELLAAETGVSHAGLAVADYGTVTLRTTTDADEFISLYPSRHVIVVAEADITPSMTDAFSQLEEEFDAGTRTQILATGPSATADMGSLVRGVHGPESIHVLIVEER
ncbi:LUD domain-containing protein [Haladaptatus sp. DJG-WS-42]|uniref:LUD domain-containing protein n=1 Tax=Haladaptatus sp. DJG-WS-42 TaxID=3120516 RepID=UPI0030CC59BE